MKLCQCKESRIRTALQDASSFGFTPEDYEPLFTILQTCTCQENVGSTEIKIKVVDRIRFKDSCLVFVNADDGKYYAKPLGANDFELMKFKNSYYVQAMNDFFTGDQAVMKVVVNSKINGRCQNVLVKAKEEPKQDEDLLPCKICKTLTNYSITAWCGCSYYDPNTVVKQECDHIVGYQSDEDDWGKTYQRPVRLSFIEYFSQKNVYLDVSLNYCDDCGKKITFDWSTINAPLDELIRIAKFANSLRKTADELHDNVFLASTNGWKSKKYMLVNAVDEAEDLIRVVWDLYDKQAEL